MLETILQIASVVSAVTAVTTSLRALGKSREYSRYELEALKSRARLSHIEINQSPSLQKQLSLYRVVTLIWFVLSIIFAMSLLILRWKTQKDIWVLLLKLLPFLLLGIVLWLIWRRICAYNSNSRKY